MTARMIAAVVGSLVVLGCGGASGGNNNDNCEDLFTTPVKYAGKEVVAGCYFPGTYSINATVSQSKGTCDALFDWQATSGSAHQCAATLSGDASSGYDIDFKTCSLPGSIHISPDLSTFTGSFSWTVSCGSGTTTFQNMAKS